MKKLVLLFVVLLMATSFAISPSAQDAKSTFRNGYAWSGNNKDNATSWAQAIEAQAEISGGTIGTGSVFYVDSGVAAEGNGTSWTQAKDTIDEAVNLCTADRGDFILVAQGHTETLGAGADGVDVDVAGVTIIGAGSGELRPMIDYDTATDEFVIGADDVTIVNLTFKSNIDSTVKAIDIEAGAENWSIIGCRFYLETTGTDEFDDAIIVGAACDNGLLADCLFEMGAGDAQSAVNLVDSDYTVIANNLIFGDYGVACIENATTASIHPTIANNVLFNGTIGGAAGLNAQPCIELKSDTSAIILNNDLYCNVATPDAAIVAADGFLAGNTYSETEGGVSPAPMWLTTDTVDNVIGINDGANLGVTNSVVADADGSIVERLEYIQVSTAGGPATATIAGRTYTASMTSTVSTQDDLFDVDGGAILITSLTGVVTTGIQAQGTVVDINLDADAGWTDYDFSTSVELNGDAAGTRYVFDATVNESVLTPLEGADNGAAQGMVAWHCGEGMIELASTAASTGNIKWYMTWIPFDDGTTVTAQ